MATSFATEKFSMDTNYFETVTSYINMKYYPNLHAIPHENKNKIVVDVHSDTGIKLGVMVKYENLDSYDEYLFHLLQLYKIRSDFDGSLVLIELGM